MAEAKKPAPAAEAPSAAGSGKKNTVLFIVIGLLVLVILIGGGLAAWLVLTIQANQNFGEPVASAEHGAEEDGHGDEAKDKKKKKKKKEKEGEHVSAPVFDKLDVFTVNLQGGTVLQTEIHVQVADEKKKEFVKGYLPRISSQVNLLLSSKKPEEVATMEQKMKLMEEIKMTINKVLDASDEEEGVMSVEFKTFIVQ